MSQNQNESASSPKVARWLPIIALVGAIGIAAVFWLSNASNSTAQECPVSPEIITQLESSIGGQMAALLVTGTGRGYGDLSFVDAEGNDKTIADYAGRPLLVNFWATWCGPCREEMPALDALSAKYGGENFALLTIDLDLGDDGMAKAAAFLNENNLPNLPLLGDPTFAAFERLKNSGVSLGLPTTLLLDAKGCELAVLQGAAPWNSESAFGVIEKLIALAG